MSSITEKDDLTHSMAHYIISVHWLNEGRLRSRAIDLADHLKVARSTVTLAVRRLKQHGFLEEDSEHNLKITKKAHTRVHDVLANRSLLHYFFSVVLGVSEKNTIRDACKIEALLSAETQEKLFLFIKESALCPHQKGPAPKNSSCICNFQDLSSFRNAQFGDSLHAISAFTLQPP